MNAKNVLFAGILSIGMGAYAAIDPATYVAPKEGVYYYTANPSMNQPAGADGRWSVWDAGTEAYVEKAWNDIKENFSNGTAIIDRKPGDTTVQQNSIGAMKLDTFINTGAAEWHWYFSASDYTLEVKDLLQFGDATVLRLRNSSGAKNTTFKSTGKVSLLTGAMYFGKTTNDLAVVNTSTGLSNFYANDVEIAAADTVLGIQAVGVVDIKNLKFDAPSVAGKTSTFTVLGGSQAATTGYPDIKIGTLEVASSEGVAATLGISAGKAKSVIIDEIKLSALTNTTSTSKIIFYTDNYAVGPDTENPETGATGLNIKKITVTDAGYSELVFSSATNTTPKVGEIAFGVAAIAPNPEVPEDPGTPAVLSTADSNLRLLGSGTGATVMAQKITMVAGSKGLITLGNSATNKTSLSVNDIILVGDGVDAANTLLSVQTTTKQSTFSSLIAAERVDLSEKVTFNIGTSGTHLLAFNHYDLKVGTGSQMTVYADKVDGGSDQKVTVSGGSTLNYGTGTGTGAYLTEVKLHDIDVLGASKLNIFTANAVISGTIDASGAGTAVVLGAGTTAAPTLDSKYHLKVDTVNLSDGASLTSRRVGGNTTTPSHYFKDFNIKSNVAAGTTTTAMLGSSSDYRYSVNDLHIENLNFKASSAADAGKAQVTIHVSGSGDAVGSEKITIGAVSLEAGSNAVISTRGNVRAGSITALTGSNLKIYSLNGYVDTTDSTPATFTVTGNVTSNANLLDVSGTNFVVKGNFTNTRNYVDGNNRSQGLDLNLTNGGSFTVEGYLQNDGTLLLNESGAAAATNISVGGLTSTTTNARISSQEEYKGGATSITLTGNGTYVYKGRIHDIGSGTTAEDAAAMTTGSVGVIKNGAGTQFLIGSNYYRGDTVINSGKLYMKNNLADNAAEMGIGAVSLKGGAFGGVGAVDASNKVTQVGTINVGDFTWSSAGNVDVFVDGGTSSLINAMGIFAKDSGDAAGDKYNFFFEFLGGAILETEDAYKLIAFEDGSMNPYADADFTYTTDDATVLDIIFKVKGDGVYATIVIPEPSAYAALFGALALICALRRRR